MSPGCPHHGTCACPPSPGPACRCPFAVSQGGNKAGTWPGPYGLASSPVPCAGDPAPGLGTAALSPPAMQSGGSPSADSTGCQIPAMCGAPGSVPRMDVVRCSCLTPVLAPALPGGQPRVLGFVQHWKSGGAHREGAACYPPPHPCLSFPRYPAWPGACLGQEWGQSEGWEEAVALTRSTLPPQPGCTQPSSSRVTRSGALIPAGRGPEGCSREFLPVQAAAAPASREQEASHSHSSSGDDVRPGHKEGG